VVTHMTPRLVGSTQYNRLFRAMEYYEELGFRPIDVPWTASKEVIDITRPAWAGEETLQYSAGNIQHCPVASAEQSFLQLQLDAIRTGTRIHGSFVGITPCFRNEPTLGELHQAYFMKVELISWDRTDHQALQEMLDCAKDFFDRWIDVDVIDNTDPDPIGEIAIDIIAKHTGIELGSYGIRNHPSVGRWLYGTGLAEPRLTVALDAEGEIQESKASF
jgi:hypothetical protein